MWTPWPPHALYVKIDNELKMRREVGPGGPPWGPYPRPSDGWARVWEAGVPRRTSSCPERGGQAAVPAEAGCRRSHDGPASPVTSAENDHRERRGRHAGA